MIFVWYFGFSFSNVRFYLSSSALFGFQESDLGLICTVFSFFFSVSVWFSWSRNEVQCVLDFWLVSKKVKENDMACYLFFFFMLEWLIKMIYRRVSQLSSLFILVGVFWKLSKIVSKTAEVEGMVVIAFRNVWLMKISVTSLCSMLLNFWLEYA